MYPCFSSRSKNRNALVRDEVYGFLADDFIAVLRGNVIVTIILIPVDRIRNFFIFW
jgi:hypothetical protein